MTKRVTIWVVQLTFFFYLFNWEILAFKSSPPLHFFSRRNHELLTAQCVSLSLPRRAVARLSAGKQSIDKKRQEKKEVIPPSSPLLIQLASSPLGAIVVLLGVVLFHESGHYLAAKALGVHPEEFSVGFGPKITGIQAFGDEFNLRAVPFGGYVRFSAFNLLQLSWQERVAISSAGPVFNFFLAFLFYFIQIFNSGGTGLMQYIFDQGVIVSGTAGPDAAANGIVRRGDLIVAVNSTPVPTISPKSPSEDEAQRAISKIITTVQSTPDGESVQLSILRNRKASNPLDLRIRPKLNDAGTPSIGIFLEPNVVGAELLQSDSPLEAASLAFQYTWVLSREIAIGLVTFARDFVSRKKSEYGVRGPLGVIERASEVVATQDRRTILNYAAGISINFGVVNLFPVPPSDGFQIAFVVAETLWQQQFST